MILRRILLTLTAASAALALACSDAGVAPQDPTPIAGMVQSPANLDRFGGLAWSTTLTIQPTGGEYNLFGVYTLSVPANAVCDPALPGCVPATRPISLRATLQVIGRRLSIDFDHVEFVPTAEVILSTYVHATTIKLLGNRLLTDRKLAKAFVMMWADSPTDALSDDAATDASIRTHIELKTGRIWRRVKHFSGYIIFTTGEPCDPEQGDPDCIWVDDENPVIHP